MDIEDFKLELTALQNKDIEDATALGFNNKDSWFKYIINKDKDEVAEAIIDLAKRYQVQDNVVAYYFDPTMLIRISKIKNNFKEASIAK